MAKYFFNLHDGQDILDDIGSEHPDIASARAEAVDTIGERLRGKLLAGTDITAWVMNVTDYRGVTVIILSFSAAVQIILPPLNVGS